MTRLYCRPVVMGIDPGLAHTGAAIVEGRTCTHTETIRTTPADGNTEQRAARIVQHLAALLPTHRVTHVALERWTYHGRGTTQGTITAFLVGMCAALALVGDCPDVKLYDPLDWGRTLTGHAARTKQGVARAVSLRLGMPFKATGGGHMTDAIGLAIVRADELEPTNLRHSEAK
jgi:Holliday junction resolvasome RuvABC endonuclease subunit